VTQLTHGIDSKAHAFEAYTCHRIIIGLASLRQFGGSGLLGRFPKLPFANKHIDRCAFREYYVAKTGVMSLFLSGRSTRNQEDGKYASTKKLRVLRLDLTSSSEKSAH
jgi:hypothetical protein